ncbi:MAG: triose-phosphate isomerase, partial [Treponema sp.]|nr:triose-phosphate isomerase [Treponema sp.]
MARTHYIAGNWKMNTSKAEAVQLAKDLVAALKDKPNKYMVGVPFVYLDAVGQVLKGSNIRLGAQDMAATGNGAHTGEVSAEMLKDLGVQSVILGHSERRHEIGESDELINKKVRRALEQGLEVVLCIGELLSEREAGNAESVCAFQLDADLSSVTAEQMKNVVIAYEPVWAIGTGKTATPEDAEAIHKFVRAHIEKLYGKTVAENVIIQYGGSMKASNAK